MGPPSQLKKERNMTEQHQEPGSGLASCTHHYTAHARTVQPEVISYLFKVIRPTGMSRCDGAITVRRRRLKFRQGLSYAAFLDCRYLR